MYLHEFMQATGIQKPLLAYRGNIFETPADHIAFAVHWPNDEGYSNNDNGGFSSRVAEFGWPELGSITFRKGISVSKKINGKHFHALPVHTPQKDGWDETPYLIEDCLNKLPVSSTDVIAIVLIGGGKAGEKYKASIKNLEGMIRTYKTVVLYVYDDIMFNLLIGTGVVAQGTPLGTPLSEMPRVYKYREMVNKDLKRINELVTE